jgi:hypothetical protein
MTRLMTHVYFDTTFQSKKTALRLASTLRYSPTWRITMSPRRAVPERSTSRRNCTAPAAVHLDLAPLVLATSGLCFCQCIRTAVGARPKVCPDSARDHTAVRSALRAVVIKNADPGVTRIATLLTVVWSFEHALHTHAPKKCTGPGQCARRMLKRSGASPIVLCQHCSRSLSSGPSK